MAAVLLEVCNWLKAKSVMIPVSNEWLQSCVEYFKSENPSCDVSDIKNFAYEQWLLADLSDVKAGCFPINCPTVPKVVLQGKYAVQVNYVVNVAESFYKQMQTIRRPDAIKNLEVDCDRAELQTQQTQQAKLKRSLKMELTDGIISIIAFEDQPIPKLVEPIVPGVKVLIIGPVECRKGVLLLKSSNIEIIGGEVDTLLIPNAVENVLARALGLEESSEPYKSMTADLDDDEDDEAFVMLADEIESTVSSRTTQQASSYSTQSQNSSVTTQHSNSSRAQPRNFNSLPVSNNDMDEDELALIAAETAMLIERRVSPSQPKNTVLKPKNQPTLDSFLVPSQHSITASSERSNSNGQIPQRLTAGNQPSILRAQLQESYSSSNNSRLNQNQTLLKRNETSGRQKSSNIRNTRSFIVDSSPAYSEASTVESEWRPTLNVKSNAALPKPLLRDNEMIVDYLDDEALVASVMECEAEFSQASQSQPRPSNLEQEALFPPKTYPSERTVMASVVKIPQKLSMRDDRWCLSAIIKAKGVELEVDFSSDTLDKIFGITAAELKAKRNEVRSNPEIKERINEILKASQLRIRNLKCKMVIKFTSIIAKPVIADVIDK